MDRSLKIEKYNLRALGEMLQSNFWEGQKHIPITPYRIRSYLNNPRAEHHRPVLYTLLYRDELVAYRSILSDYLYIAQKKIPIGWFSGNWTHPDHRRKGYSSLLLEVVHEDWAETLFFSNFAPASKQVLDQSGQYEIFKILKGKRFYFKFALGKLLPPKSAFFEMIRPGLIGIDRLLNAFISSRKEGSISNGVKWESCAAIGDEEMDFLSAFKVNELFRRGAKEYNWILQYPWIKCTDESDFLNGKYHFSAHADSFDQQFFRLRVKGQIEGLLLISIRDAVMKVPYAYLTEEALPAAARLILGFAINENVLHLTVFHQGLLKELNNFKRFYLFRKEFEQAFLANKELLRQFSDIKEKEIQKGDGDAVFT